MSLYRPYCLQCQFISLRAPIVFHHMPCSSSLCLLYWLYSCFSCKLFIIRCLCVDLGSDSNATLPLSTLCMSRTDGSVDKETTWLDSKDVSTKTKDSKHSLAHWAHLGLRGSFDIMTSHRFNHALTGGDEIQNTQTQTKCSLALFIFQIHHGALHAIVRKHLWILGNGPSVRSVRRERICTHFQGLAYPLQKSWSL